MSTRNATARRNGFTLIELLVVIAIISLLLAILMPALSSAKQRANSAVCLSRLRGIGMVMATYAAQEDQWLPPGYDSSGADWRDYFALTMMNWTDRPSNVTRVGLRSNTVMLKNFTDSDTQSVGNLHYGCHPRLMPGYNALDYSITYATAPIHPGLKQYKLSFIERPSDVTIIMDAAQVIKDNNGSANSAVSSLNGSAMTASNRWLLYPVTGFPQNKNTVSIDGGQNYDPDTYAAGGTQASNLRWRHMNNTVANFLFVDGHADSGHYTSQNNTDIVGANVNVNHN